MNAPVTTDDSQAVSIEFADYKATLITAAQAAVAAIETPVPWCARSDAFQNAFYDAKQAAYEFIKTILDRMISVPAYIEAQDRIITDNLYAAANCFEIIADSATSDAERDKAAAMMRVQTDTVYFSLNNSCGKLLNLHGNLYYYKDTLSAAALKLQELADVGPKGAEREIDQDRLEAIKSHKQHLSAMLRAASWRQIDAGLTLDAPIELTAFEVADELNWAQLPLMAGPVLTGYGPIALDEHPLLQAKAKLLSLYQGLTNTEKSAVLANATANTIGTLAIEAREVMANRMQVGNMLETITGRIDLAMGQCVLAQSAIADGDYKIANHTLRQLAGDWHAAVEAARAIAVNIRIYADTPLSIGMEDHEVRDRLAEATARSALTS